MQSPNNRTPEEYRAALRAEVRNTVRVALEACAPNARSLWAAAEGVSHQLLDRSVARDGDKSLHLADLLAAPQAVRHAVAQLLIGEGHCIAELPAAAPCPDDLSLLASHVRETSAAQLALVEAMADGSVSADEGARLVECSQRVHAVTATVAALGRRAVANRSVRLKAVAR